METGVILSPKDWYRQASTTSVHPEQMHKAETKYWCDMSLKFSIWEGILLNTVEPRYLELAYFELPLISKWKSGPCFNIKLWQQVTK